MYYQKLFLFITSKFKGSGEVTNIFLFQNWKNIVLLKQVFYNIKLTSHIIILFDVIFLSTKLFR